MTEFDIVLQENEKIHESDWRDRKWKSKKEIVRKFENKRVWTLESDLWVNSLVDEMRYGCRSQLITWLIVTLFDWYNPELYDMHVDWNWAPNPQGQQHFSPRGQQHYSSRGHEAKIVKKNSQSSIRMRERVC